MGFFSTFCHIGFAASVVLAAAFPSDDSTLIKRDHQTGDVNCDEGPGWAPRHFIGSSEPATTYCETQFGHDYTPVKTIEVWRKGDKNGDRIAGLQFTYASGVTSQVYGHADTSKYPVASFTFDSDETVKNAILYGDGHGNWLGHIYLETSKGRTFDAGRDTKNIDPYSIDVGGGLLLGAVILTRKPDKDANEDDVSKLGLLFLGQPIDHITIQDIKFTEDPSGSSSGIEPQNVVVGKWFNHDVNKVGYSLTPTYGVTSSYSYSQQTAISFGGSFSVEISAEIFDIGTKVTDEFTWEVSRESATTTATTSSTVVACVATGTLEPNQGVQVTGKYQTGKNTWDYESSVVVYLKDGHTYTYSEKGQLTNVAYNECTTEWTPLNVTNINNSPGLSKIAARALPTPT